MSQHSFNNLFGELLEAGADSEWELFCLTDSADLEATANMLLTMILAFAKFPEVQVKARKELDALCGVERLPVFTDFKDLPYINAIIKEALRWRPT